MENISGSNICTARPTNVANTKTAVRLIFIIIIFCVRVGFCNFFFFFIFGNHLFYDVSFGGEEGSGGVGIHVYTIATVTAAIRGGGGITATDGRR